MADVGVRLAWGLLVGVVAQYLGAHLGQVPLRLSIDDRCLT